MPIVPTYIPGPYPWRTPASRLTLTVLNMRQLNQESTLNQPEERRYVRFN